MKWIKIQDLRIDLDNLGGYEFIENHLSSSPFTLIIYPKYKVQGGTGSNTLRVHWESDEEGRQDWLDAARIMDQYFGIKTGEEEELFH